MAERTMFNFTNVKSSDNPVTDFDQDKNYVIQQGELQPDVIERIKSAERGELKAKLAAILSRGVIQDRLRVDLPPEVHGEWVRNDPLETRRLETLGFEIDKIYAPARAIGSNADGSAVVGDVVFMTCSQEVYDVIQEIRRDDLINQHSKKRGRVDKYRGDYNKEEEDFVARVRQEGTQHVKGFSESQEHAATYDDVKRALQTVDSQVKPFD